MDVEVVHRAKASENAHVRCDSLVRKRLERTAECTGVAPVTVCAVWHRRAAAKEASDEALLAGRSLRTREPHRHRRLEKRQGDAKPEALKDTSPRDHAYLVAP